jgi:hypothetical protein
MVGGAAGVVSSLDTGFRIFFSIIYLFIVFPETDLHKTRLKIEKSFRENWPVFS